MITALELSEGWENFMTIITKGDNVPIAMMLPFVGYYTWHSLRKAFKNDKLSEPIESTMTDRVQVWPYLTRIEFLACIILTIFLTVWSIVIDAPLEEPANPANTPNPSKAPWYFLGLQEMLVYFDPWMAGVVLPSFIIFGLMTIPYVDINPRGNGYYTFKERKFAISFFIFGFVGLWVMMIILGTFIRGPGWELYWPWEDWGVNKVIEHNNVDLSEWIGRKLNISALNTKDVLGNYQSLSMLTGTAFVILYYAAGIPALSYMLKKTTNNDNIVKDLGPLRFGHVYFYVWTTLLLVLKIVLRLTISIKYFIATPWFNL